MLCFEERIAKPEIQKQQFDCRDAEERFPINDGIVTVVLELAGRRQIKGGIITSIPNLSSKDWTARIYMHPLLFDP